MAAEQVFDRAAYFGRIGYAGEPEPTLETLTALVAAHNRCIPFENLDPVMGLPIFDLSPAALTDKLVRRRRGGYCYEHNNLIGYALSDLGFGVDRLIGRVVWMDPAGVDGPPHSETHQVLAVRIPGADGTDLGPYLVDVGFGGQTLSSPIRLAVGDIQQTRHEPYRLRTHARGCLLEALVAGTWQPLYIFSTEPRPLIDSQVGSWYVSTHPESIFVVGLSAALVTDEARWNLRGRNLAIHHRGGGTERIRFDTAAQVCGELTDRFGIDLSGLGDVEARIARVLDS